MQLPEVIASPRVAILAHNILGFWGVCTWAAMISEGYGDTHRVSRPSEGRGGSQKVMTLWGPPWAGACRETPVGIIFKRYKCPRFTTTQLWTGTKWEEMGMLRRKEKRFSEKRQDSGMTGNNSGMLWAKVPQNALIRTELTLCKLNIAKNVKIEQNDRHSGIFRL